MVRPPDAIGSKVPVNQLVMHGDRESGYLCRDFTGFAVNLTCDLRLPVQGGKNTWENKRLYRTGLRGTTD